MKMQGFTAFCANCSAAAAIPAAAVTGATLQGRLRVGSMRAMLPHMADEYRHTEHGRIRVRTKKPVRKGV